MTLLWRDAGPYDREALSRWACAHPESAKYDRVRRIKVHPRPWEHDVQSWIRTTKVPRMPPERFLIGLDDHGIAAVTSFGPSDVHPRMAMIYLVARAARCVRHRHGAEALSVALAELGSDGFLGVQVRIDQRNEPSRVMVQHQGFRFAKLSKGFEIWGRRLNSGQVPNIRDMQRRQCAPAQPGKG